jgi:hypothetical protein
MGGVLPPPQVPYTPNPGTYTQLWMWQTSTRTNKENKAELVAYLDVYTESESPDYTAIQSTILTSRDWYGFLTILPDSQICLVHLLGKHSSGLGRPTPRNDRKSWQPTAASADNGPIRRLDIMVENQELQQLTMESLGGLAQMATKKVLLPQEAARANNEDEDDDTNKASVQSICYVPKAWAAHFLDPLSPWTALQTFHRWQTTTGLTTSKHGS